MRAPVTSYNLILYNFYTGWQSRSPGLWAENGFQGRIFKVGLRSSKSVSPSCVRETVNGAKSVSWFQSRSAAFCGENVFSTAGTISTRRVDSFCAKLPPCLLTRTILTRAVRDPPRVWASRTEFFEEKGSGFLNLTPNYRSRPLHQTHTPQPPPTGDPGLVSLGFAPV